MVRKSLVIAISIFIVFAGCTQTDQRTLLTLENKAQLAPDISDSFDTNSCLKENPINNVDPANTTITYSNNEQGFKVDLPYNKAWGPERFRIAPYDVSVPTSNLDISNSTISFGPIRNSSKGNNCEIWNRDFIITINDPVDSLKELIDEQAYYIKLLKSSDLVTLSNYKTSKGLDVLEQTTKKCSSANTLTVLGNKHTYIFNAFCNSNDDIEVLKKIIDTIELL